MITTTTEQSIGPTPFETLTGETPVTVTLRNGTQRVLRVHQLSIREFPRLLELQGKEEELLALYTREPVEILEQLTTGSELLLLDEGDRVNADFFARWVQRRFRLNQVLAPDAQRPSGKPQSPTGSPIPASPQA